MSTKISATKPLPPALAPRPAAAPGPRTGERDCLVAPLLATLLAAQEPPATAQGSSGGEAGPVRFRGTAYDGKTVNQWWGTTIVDLEGVEPLTQRLPLLLEHGYAMGADHDDIAVGFVEQMTAAAGVGIEIAGAMLSKESAQNIVRDAREGYPWELSIRAVPLAVEELQPDVVATVNGQEVRGPITIFRRSVIREVSVTHVGAAQQTRLELAASQRSSQQSNGDPAVATTIETDKIDASWVKANKPDVYDAIQAEATKVDDEGGKPVEEVAASFDDLRAIFASDTEMIVKAQIEKATPSRARAMLAERHTSKIDQLTKQNADLQARLDAATAAGGSPAVPAGPKGTANLKASGQNPETDWNNSAELRASWEQKTGGNKRAARAAFLAFAEQQVESGESYLTS